MGHYDSVMARRDGRNSDGVTRAYGKPGRQVVL